MSRPPPRRPRHRVPDATPEGGVGLPLLFEYWQGPGVLAGDDALLFPVGALDEADAEGGAPRLGQGAELRDGLLRVGEVGLDDDADLGEIAELGLEKDVGE